MILSLTGTPGTGKTSVAEKLKEEGFKVVDLTAFVKERNLGEQREEFEVDIDKMIEALEKELEDIEKDVIIEGHLSHHFPSDYCIVLRCNPEELEERLEKRKYTEEKVKENVESEILDIVLSEAVQRQDRIVELDTSGENPKNIAKQALNKIENEETGYGEIDWTQYLN